MLQNRMSFYGLAVASLCVTLASPGWASVVADFEDLGLAPETAFAGPVPGGTIVSGPYGDVVEGSFSSSGVQFVNRYDTTYGSWNGFAASNQTDTTTAGYGNQFSAITGSGAGSGNDSYAVAFGNRDVDSNLFSPTPFDPMSAADLQSLPSLYLPDWYEVVNALFTNTTYAYLSMREGDGFAKKFGGASQDEADYFKLSIYGIGVDGNTLGSFVEFYLADFRFADNSFDYLISDWTLVDLSSLADARSLHFNLSSSDSGDYGMNTPGYFAMDNLVLAAANSSIPALPEPASLVLVGFGTAIFGLRRRT